MLRHAIVVRVLLFWSSMGNYINELLNYLVLEHQQQRGVEGMIPAKAMNEWIPSI